MEIRFTNENEKLRFWGAKAFTRISGGGEFSELVNMRGVTQPQKWGFVTRLPPTPLPPTLLTGLGDIPPITGVM